MARIFAALAAFAVLLLATNLVLGFRSGQYNAVAQQYLVAQQELHRLSRSRDTAPEQLREQQDAFRRLGRQVEALEAKNVVHFLFGLAASLVTVLVNSIAVTYFIGTSRWCKEVVEIYDLDGQLARRSTRLKRRTFPWALGGILAVLLTIALGGAALPFGAAAGHSARWVVPHACAALLGTVFIGWSFLVQIGNIAANYEVIQAVVDEVQRIRAERGLDSAGSAEG